MAKYFNVEITLTKTYLGKNEPLICRSLFWAHNERDALKQAQNLRYPYRLPESEFRIVPRMG